MRIQTHKSNDMTISMHDPSMTVHRSHSKASRLLKCDVLPCSGQVWPMDLSEHRARFVQRAVVQSFHCKPVSFFQHDAGSRNLSFISHRRNVVVDSLVSPRGAMSRMMMRMKLVMLIMDRVGPSDEDHVVLERLSCVFTTPLCSGHEIRGHPGVSEDLGKANGKRRSLKPGVFQF